MRQSPEKEIYVLHIESGKDRLKDKPERAIPKTQVRYFFSLEPRATLKSTKNSLRNTAKI